MAQESIVLHSVGEVKIILAIPQRQIPTNKAEGAL